MYIYFQSCIIKLPPDKTMLGGGYCPLNLLHFMSLCIFFFFNYFLSSVKLMICLFFYSLWDLCNSEHSHICQVCVPLLLHCITLPSGSDMFWKVIQEEFHNADWRYRFVAGMCNAESDLCYYYYRIFSNLIRTSFCLFFKRKRVSPQF